MWVGPCRPRGPGVSIRNGLGILVMGNPSIPPLPRDSPSRTGGEPNDSTVPRLCKVVPKLASNQGQRRQEQSKFIFVYNLVLGGEEGGEEKKEGAGGEGEGRRGKRDRREGRQKEGKRGEQN